MANSNKKKGASQFRPYITLFHHNHGTSFTIIAARSEREADTKAEKLWVAMDGMEADPDERDRIGEFYEVGEASVSARGWTLKLERRRTK